MTDIRKQIDDAGNGIDVSLGFLKDLVSLLYETAVDNTCVGDTVSRDTLQRTATLMHYLETELTAVEAHHDRMWKAANQATGREAMAEDAKPKA